MSLTLSLSMQLGGAGARLVAPAGFAFVINAQNQFVLNSSGQRLLAKVT